MLLIIQFRHLHPIRCLSGSFFLIQDGFATSSRHSAHPAPGTRPAASPVLNMPSSSLVIPIWPELAPLRLRKKPGTRRLFASSEVHSTRRRSSDATSNSTGSLSESLDGDAPLVVQKRRTKPCALPPTSKSLSAEKTLRLERIHARVPPNRKENETGYDFDGELCVSTKLPPVLARVSCKEEPGDMNHEAKANGEDSDRYPLPIRPCCDTTNATPSPRFGSAPSVAPAGHCSRDRGEGFVLVPHVAVTPETQALEDEGGTIWVAVEVLGRVCHSRDGHPTPSGCLRDACCFGTKSSLNTGISSSQCFHQNPFADDGETDFGKYGTLSNVKVNVLPVGQTAVLQVLRDDPPVTYAYIFCRGF